MDPTPGGHHGADPLAARALAAAGRLSRAQVWVAALAFTGLVVAGDVLTGADVAFTSLYLVPIAFGGWLAGRRLAQVVAAVATLTALGVDLAAHAQRPAWLHVWNAACQAGVFLAFAAVVPRLEVALRAGLGRSQLDALTGLPGRAAFFEQADREVVRARRDGRPLSVLYLDVEGLDRINRDRGRDAGDQALKVVGAVLSAELRGIDVCGRLGSDEFAVLLPDTALGAAHAVALRLRQQVVARGLSLELPVAVSVGVACFLGQVQSTEVMVAAADARRFLDRHAELVPPRRGAMAPGPGRS